MYDDRQKLTAGVILAVFPYPRYCNSILCAQKTPKGDEGGEGEGNDMVPRGM